MREIFLYPLSGGKFTRVDDSDYDWLNQWKWRLQKGVYNTDYVTRTDYRWADDRTLKPFCILMHRAILAPIPKNLEIDHRDGDGLNNQRNNLRPATTAQNQWNRQLSCNNTSGFKGVSKVSVNRWTASIQCNGAIRRLGRFSSPEDAAIAYNNAATELYGEFSRLNDIEAAATSL